MLSILTRLGSTGTLVFFSVHCLVLQVMGRPPEQSPPVPHPWPGRSRLS